MPFLLLQNLFLDPQTHRRLGKVQICNWQTFVKYLEIKTDKGESEKQNQHRKKVFSSLHVTIKEEIRELATQDTTTRPKQDLITKGASQGPCPCSGPNFRKQGAWTNHCERKGHWMRHKPSVLKHFFARYNQTNQGREPVRLFQAGGLRRFLSPTYNPPPAGSTFQKFTPFDETWWLTISLVSARLISMLIVPRASNSPKRSNSSSCFTHHDYSNLKL